jgi:ElaB/YqjD/DUF883 family membrane-anchored ribosome-binding protein
LKGKIMSGFTPEQQAEIDERMQKMRAELEAQYTAKAHKLRAWINAHPLAASRVAFAVGFVIGFGGSMAVRAVISWI